MKRKHIAFCVEPAYGHIVPTLGTTLELLRRGHLVSYAVTESFSKIVHKVNAQSKIIHPLDNRTDAVEHWVKKNDCFNWNACDPQTVRRIEEASRQRTAHSLSELELLYENDRPDVIIHNNAQDAVGIVFASKFGIAKIRHQTQFIDVSSDTELQRFADEELILMGVPEFFQPNADRLDKRFKFVGFTSQGRVEVFDRWECKREGKRPILISPTTGGTASDRILSCHD